MPGDSLRVDAAPMAARAAPAAWMLGMMAVPRWAVVLAAALVARAVTFGNPIVDIDEQFYFVTAQRMLEGALPYVDIWDRKPIGLFLLYTPAAAFGVPMGIWVYQAMALASVVATALLIARLAERAGWARGALVAALLYVFWLDLADGQGGQAPVFYNLLMVGAITLAAPRTDDADVRRRMARGVAALGLVGLALQIKYSVVFEGMFLGLWLMAREWRLGVRTDRVLAYGSTMVAAALLPTLLALAVYAALGRADAFLYANFGSILERQSDPAPVLLISFLKIALILGPLLVLSGLSRRMCLPDAKAPVRGLLFGWLVAAVAGLVVFGGWFNHYALPVMAPAALCSAGFLGLHRIGRRIALPFVALALIVGETVVLSARWHRGDGAQLEALADAIGHGPGCLYVYSGNPILYSYTGRCALTAWIFPSHLLRARESRALGIDPLAEIDRIFARKPERVVMRPFFKGERRQVRDRVMQHLTAGYRHAGSYPVGDEMLQLYARRRPGQAAATDTGMARPLRLASTSSE